MATAKAAFPLDQVRRYLEPGPIVLVSSQHHGASNIMTMGWHTMMEFTPALFGCVISPANHSHGLIRASGECVVNLPTAAMVDAVVGVGNSDGTDTDKFAAFGLTAEESSKVAAPSIGECHASFECRLHDDALVERYAFFIFEIVAARVRPSPKHPETLHYIGGGEFMLAGKTISRRSTFRPGNL